MLPEVKNVLSRPVTTPLLPVRRQQPLPFATPADAGLAATFTAGSTPGTGRLQAGAVRATVTVYDAQGRVLVQDEPVTCSAPSPRVTVTTISIT